MELRQVHAVHCGVSGIPPGWGLSHLSWWMSGLPDCTFSFHFLPGCAEAVPPTVHCHFFNPLFFHSHEVWAIMLSHIPVFNSLHTAAPLLLHPTLFHHTHTHTPLLTPPHEHTPLSWSAFTSTNGVKNKCYAFGSSQVSYKNIHSEATMIIIINNSKIFTNYLGVMW